MSSGRPYPPREIPEIESDIRAYVRQEATRQPGDQVREQAEREAVGTYVPDLIQRVAGSSVTEIDRLIAELTQLRDHLQREGKRVETEIAAFAQTGNAAVSSIKEISQTLGRFKRVARLDGGE